MNTYVTVAIEVQGLSERELAQAVGVDEAWVQELLSARILCLEAPAAAAAPRRFGSADLQRALAVRRLQRDFGAGLDAAALILDLQDEIRRLRARLAAHGID